MQMTSPNDFTPYANLADELIEKATKDQLADAVRLLALNIGYYHERYGDVPQDTLLKMVRAETLDEDGKRLLLHGMQNLVSALAEVMGLARASNGYLDAKRPWTQRKEDPPGCDTTVNVCIQTVKALATLMAPFLPFSARTCATMLNLADDGLRWQSATSELPCGHTLNDPVILFEKLDAVELFG